MFTCAPFDTLCLAVHLLALYVYLCILWHFFFSCAPFGTLCLPVHPLALYVYLCTL